MNTMKAEHESAIDRLRVNLARRDYAALISIAALIATRLTIFGFVTS